MDIEGYIKDICRLTDDMYRLGWDERNGGNISVLLRDGELLKRLSSKPVKTSFTCGYAGKNLDGEYLLVTGSGKYFRNVSYEPEKNLGVIRISKGTAQLLWGLEGGGSPTSELPAHLISHEIRLKANPKQRIIIHCHPTNLVAMSFVHSLDEARFTKTLWRMISECIIVFPDGVSVLPWMVFGNEKIGRATAEKMKDSRLTVWPHHGIFGAGNDIDEAFGLIETAEKAAKIYMKTAGFPIKNTITDAQLRELADAFGVAPRDGVLNA